MCGIVASIGESKNPKVSHLLTTALLEKTEIRGDNATGFWTTEVGSKPNDAIIWYKEPKKSTDFVKSEIWKGLTAHTTDLFIGHCRKSSDRGSEAINKNNHPFVGSDGTLALVHNGVIPEFETLRTKYDVESSCDSEVLLRMLESGHGYNDEYIRKSLGTLNFDAENTFSDIAEDQELPSWTYRLMGLRDIFARVNHGAMAVSVGERWENGVRALWIFRDKDRPLHVADLRQSLGQIFIFSTVPIWRTAVESHSLISQAIDKNSKILELPPMTVWLLTVKDKEFGFRKWKIKKERKYHTTFEDQRPKLEESRLEQQNVKVLTWLDENLEPIKKKVTATSEKNGNAHSSFTKEALGPKTEDGKNETTTKITQENTSESNSSTNKNSSTNIPTDNSRTKWDYVGQEGGLVMEGEVTHKDIDRLEEASDAIAESARDMCTNLRAMVDVQTISFQTYNTALESLQELQHDLKALYESIALQTKTNSKQLVTK